MSTPNQENLEAFLRITKTVADNNECPTPSHLTALFEEHELPIINELDQALEEAGNSLTDEQCACLFANIANLNFEDGRVKNRTLMRDAEKSLRIDSGDARDVVDGIENQLQTNQVFNEDEDWDLFCAGLIAIACSDGHFAPSEEEYVKRLTPETKHLEAGQKINSEKNMEALGECLSDFNTRQRRCLAAHSISMMFVDGEWNGSEQEYFAIAAKKMRLSQFEEERLIKGLWTLHNLSVFA
jgi:hypothetical protein